MKRFMTLMATFLLVLAATIIALPAFAADSAIPNGSVEVANGTNPANWSASRWGNNTATLTYKNEGHTGTRSLYVAMTARTDGDAKWMHDAVTVKGNTSYTYGSWYKSDIATEIDIQYTNADGSVSYAYVATVAPSANWTQLALNFVTPATASKASVMHIIAGKGWLQTDDMSLNETVVTPPVDQENYIPNASFETANGSSPAKWAKNNWGVNTAQFSYETTGRTGKSAKVTLSAYTSGDAKWFAEPVEITGGKSYLYRDYYKATVPTRVVVAFIDANNNYTYQEIAGAPASANAWAKYEATFAAPANAVKTSVYHLIDKVGSLAIDDVNLYVALPAPTDPVIANASFETAISGNPANWLKSGWGNNKPTYQYMNEGHTGTKSAKVTVASYVDGDAKWYFEPITSIKPGSQYRFTAWYKTNVTPHAVAMFIMADGSERYFGMPVPRPAANASTVWQKYSDTFSVPEGAVSGSVFMYIAQNGWLQTDDYSLTTYHPNGFSRPLLTLTFDDGHEENATTALPVLNKFGFKTTQCFATSFIEGQSKQVIDGVLAFKNSGHEICSHTVTHPFLTTVSASALTYELQHSKQYLQSLAGNTVNNFATPYGDYNAKVVDETKKFYRSHRSVDEGYNSKDNFDIYNLRVQNILDTTTPQQVAAWIAQAQTDKTWLVLVYHRIANDPGPYDAYISVFEQQMAAIASSGIIVKTTNAALDEVVSQLK